ncbi:MAG: peptide deformylase [Flavobacteriales bacterium TMED191]|nr:MAG: peptide deformylase [Flavobacteriales bacterium TMED191]|tara:strand:- start:3955 stop:4509 length:555 start_codon:yes stop_codon:yes gene_type:complete
MILPIYIYGHPVLRKKCMLIDADYVGLSELINNMFETMENASGIGLSAPQVGLSIQLFVIDLVPYSLEDSSVPAIREVFINPTIIEEFGVLSTHNEGCLSIPDIRSDVERKSSIKVKYFDQNFNKKNMTLDGLFARVFQHEYDHLNKKLFIDYLDPMRKNRINRKLSSILKGKFAKNYPVILKK